MLALNLIDMYDRQVSSLDSLIDDFWDGFNQVDGHTLDTVQGRILQQWRDIPTDNKLLYLFDRMETLPEYSNRISTTKKFKASMVEDEPYLHSISFDDVPDVLIDGTKGTYKQFLLKRAESEMQINGMFKWSKMLFVVKATYMSEGDGLWESSFYARLLYTLLYTNTNGEMYEPFWEDRESKIRYPNKIKDLAIPKKVSILIKVLIDDLNGMYQGIESVMVEVVLHILEDPYYNWKDVKEVRSGSAFLAFSLCRSGIVPRYIGTPDTGRSISGYVDLATIEPDIPYYELNIPKAMEIWKKHSKTLPHTCAYYRATISDSITEESLRKYTIMRGPEQIVGFIRGYPRLMVEEQINDAARKASRAPLNHRTERRGDITFLVKCEDDDCFDCDLIRRWRSNILDAESQGMLFSHESWERSLSAAITSKSAGLEPIKVKGVINNKETEITARSKVLMFFLDPNKYMSKSALDNLKPPFNCGFRFDKARAGRMICGIPMPPYLFEQPASRACARMQSQNNWLSMTKFDDRPISNMAPFSMYQLHPTLSYLTPCFDATAMDLHTMKSNVLDNRTQGILEGFGALNLRNKSWGEFMPIYDASGAMIFNGLQAMWIKQSSFTGAADFRIRDVGGTKIVRLMQLFSGENLTAITHNNTNLTKIRLINKRLMEVFGWTAGSRIKDSENYQLLNYNATGDDEIALMHLDHWTKETVGIVAEVASDIGGNMGFEYNPSKTLGRGRMFEYLKKAILYEVYIPLAGRPSVHDSERNRFNADPFQTVTSLQGQFSDYVSRGANDVICSRMRTFMSALKLEYRWFERSVRQTQIVPVSSVFVPKKFGGCGWMPFTIIGENKDAPALFYYKSIHPQMYNHIMSLAPMVMKKPWNAIKDFDVTKAIDLDLGIAFLGAKLEPNRLTASKMAILNLTRDGHTFDSGNAYAYSPRRVVRTLVSDLNEIREMKTQLRYKVKEVFDKPLGQPMSLKGTDFEWLNYITIEYNNDQVRELYPEECVTSVAGLQSNVRRLVRVIGSVATGAHVYSTIRILNKVIDTDFPKDIRVEVLLSDIFGNPRYQEPGFITNTLVAIGAKETTAAEAELDIRKLTINPLEMQAIRSWSTSDPILASLDVTTPTQAKFVHLRKVPREMEQVLREFGFILSLVLSAGPYHIMIQGTPQLFEYSRKKFIMPYKK